MGKQRRTILLLASLFKGTVSAPPVLLSAHLDTVAPTRGIRIVKTETEIKNRWDDDFRSRQQGRHSLDN
ncbi:MAG: hypothetical protein LASZOEIN_002295 [Candidatus Fervidibacter sp.]|jgi:hypothetical protein